MPAKIFITVHASCELGKLTANTAKNLLVNAGGSTHVSVVNSSEVIVAGALDIAGTRAEVSASRTITLAATTARNSTGPTAPSQWKRLV